VIIRPQRWTADRGFRDVLASPQPSAGSAVEPGLQPLRPGPWLPKPSAWCPPEGGGQGPSGDQRIALRWPEQVSRKTGAGFRSATESAQVSRRAPLTSVAVSSTALGECPVRSTKYWQTRAAHPATSGQAMLVAPSMRRPSMVDQAPEILIWRQPSAAPNPPYGCRGRASDELFVHGGKPMKCLEPAFLCAQTGRFVIACTRTPLARLP